MLQVRPAENRRGFEPPILDMTIGLGNEPPSFHNSLHETTPVRHNPPMSPRSSDIKKLNPSYHEVALVAMAHRIEATESLVSQFTVLLKSKVSDDVTSLVSNEPPFFV